MNKKTVAIVCVSIVLAIIAVSVIATFPTYIFEDTVKTPTNSQIESDKVTDPTPGEDIGHVGGSNGVEGVIPDISNDDIDLPETPITNYEILAESKGAKLLGEVNAFEDKTEFSVNKLGIFDKKYYRARHKIRSFAKNHLIYNIVAQKGGNEALANGIAKVVISIPQNYNLDQIEVYFISSEDNLVKLNTTVNKNDKTATVTFAQSGIYILIERKLATDSNTSTSVQNSSSDTVSSEENETSKPDSSDNNSSIESNNASSSNSDTSEGITSSDPNTSDPNTSDSNTSEPDSSEEVDPNKDSMVGWTPWY